MWGQIDTSNDVRCREIRRCAKCTQPTVTVVHVTQHYSRGLPTGRSYVHRCGGCNTGFESISWWRAITQYLFAGILTVFGFGMVAVMISAVLDYGFSVIANMDGRGWGTTALGFALFLGGLGWAAWTTWVVARLMLLHPVTSTR